MAAGFLFQLGIEFLMAGGMVAIIGALLVKFTPDYREIWLFGVVIISTYISTYAVGTISTISTHAVITIGSRLEIGIVDPWQMAAGLGAAAAGGVVAAYTAHRKFDANGSATLSAGFVSVTGILLAANSWRLIDVLLSPSLFSYMATVNLGHPLLQVALAFGGLLPVVAAAITAHLTGRLCRT